MWGGEIFWGGGSKNVKNVKEIFLYATAAARMLTAMNWKGEKVPTKVDWQNKLLESAEMAQMTKRLRGNTKQSFIQKWDTFKKHLEK